MALDWRGLQQLCKFASFLCPLGKRSYCEGPLLCGGPGQLPMLPLPRSGIESENRTSEFITNTSDVSIRGKFEFHLHSLVEVFQTS